MKGPSDLDGLDLEDVVSEIQRILYLDEGPSNHTQDFLSASIWRPGKKEVADTLIRIRAVMNAYGLEPLRDEPFLDHDEAL
jgi:hypothetical protein